MALAQTLFVSYVAAEPAERLAFLQALADRFGPDRRRIELAIEAVRQDSGQDALEGLHAAAEPRRQELIRRLNLAPGGTSALVRMREELNRILVHHTGQGMEKIEKDTDRDFFMTAEQAKDYRIVDEVISSKPTTRAVSGQAAMAAQAQR